MSSRAQENERRRQERLESERLAAAGDRRRRRLVQLATVLAIAGVLVVAGIVLSSGSGSQNAGIRDASGVVGSAETSAMLDGIPQNGTIPASPRPRSRSSSTRTCSARSVATMRWAAFPP